MNSKSRFTKIAVAAGLVVTSGAAVLGLTGFASARLAPTDTPAAVQSVDNNVRGEGTTDASGPGTLEAEGTVSAESSESVAGAIATDAPDHRGHAPVSRENLAKVLGLTVTELETQVRSGKSLADIAKAQNVDIQKVKDALVADFTAHLDAEVKAGEHTQEEADAKLVLFKARLDDMVNRARPEGGHRMGGKGAHAPRFATEDLAKVLGLSLDDLNTQLKSGKSLADIAKAQDVSIDKVKDQLLADYTAKEQAEVASGEHTQAEVDAKISEFKTRLDDIVNGVRPAGGPGMGDKGGRGGHGRGGHGPGGRHGHGPMGGDNGGAPAGPGTEDTGFSA